ncbi:MAG: Fe-S cluster assembly protein IscX [Kangiellaceae bacterium]|nr:Fe-S cluster assembly protein IscX [Kangiellaceae bacterium]
MQWTDSLDIVIELYGVHSEVEPKKFNFMDLRSMVLRLEKFNSDTEPFGERI